MVTHVKSLGKICRTANQQMLLMGCSKTLNSGDTESLCIRRALVHKSSIRLIFLNKLSTKCPSMVCAQCVCSLCTMRMHSVCLSNKLQTYNSRTFTLKIHLVANRFSNTRYMEHRNLNQNSHSHID